MIKVAVAATDQIVEARFERDYAIRNQRYVGVVAVKTSSTNTGLQRYREL